MTQTWTSGLRKRLTSYQFFDFGHSRDINAAPHPTITHARALHCLRLQSLWKRSNIQLRLHSLRNGSNKQLQHAVTNVTRVPFYAFHNAIHNAFHNFFAIIFDHIIFIRYHIPYSLSYRSLSIPYRSLSLIFCLAYRFGHNSLSVFRIGNIHIAIAAACWSFQTHRFARKIWYNLGHLRGHLQFA